MWLSEICALLNLQDALCPKQDRYQKFLPSGHPTVIRTLWWLAAEHKKIGLDTEAKNLQQQAVGYGRKRLQEVERSGAGDMYQARSLPAILLGVSSDTYASMWAG